jgi:regulator of protease activity HflC (stomatin/prohibitin superfamily)
MLGYKRIVIAQHERGLYLKDRTIRKILVPGVYRIYDLFGRIKIEVYALTVPEFEHAYTDVLLKERAALCEQHFQVVELGEYQVGLVYKNGKFSGIQRPASRKLYWKGPIEVKVEVLDVQEDYALPRKLVGLIAHARANSLPAEVITSVYFAEVADNHTGMLIVDGELAKTLTPGLYAYWKFNRKVTVEQVDLRLQAMEVQGQEILIKDKVTLRVNLSAHYKVVDVVQVRSALTHFSDHLYRELQFALRQAVSGRTLDTLLGNKGELDQEIHNTVHQKVLEHGINVHSVGVKDIILPGDMKEILNRVVETEKAAQANVIKRREETAAARSLLNTARLMDENPTLMRLKELEVLEKVTEKVDKLTVFGGLDGVLNDTVRINVRPD